jgi:hypothetical protein
MKNQLKKRIEAKSREIKKAVERVKKGSRAWPKTPADPLEMVRKDWTIDTIKKSDAKNLPAIKILREREVKMCEIDVDMPDAIEQEMYEYGVANIHKDRVHVVNWVFNLALKNAVDLLEKRKKQ